jgi:hypothetical protein
MLVISRKKDERIVVAGEIEITILQVGRNRVRFGINAPKHIHIQTHLKASPVPDGLPLTLPDDQQAVVPAEFVQEF